MKKSIPLTTPNGSCGFSLRQKNHMKKRKKNCIPGFMGSDGNDEIVIYIASPRAMKRLGQNYNIHINPEIVGNLTEFLGEKNVKIVEKSIEKK